MLEVCFNPRSDYFAADDERWLRQVRLLHEALEEEAGRPLTAVARRGAPPGTKGTLADLVLVLTGPGVVAGVVTAFTSWLNRDRGRSVHLTWNVDGRAGEFTVSGGDVDGATLRAALERGLRAIGDSQADAEAPAGDDSATDPRSDA